MNGPSEFDPLRQDEIRTIFLKVLEAAPEERDAVLEAGCGGDAALRREVEQLLGAHEDADDVLWSLARRARVPLAQGLSGFFAEGRRLGAYRLLRQIGQGGMGAVYLAERADGEFEKQVAIKLLPLGLSTSAARERFLAERQILAQLEHPGIAHLLDAGIAEDGTPFFVLEYVEGDPIDRYCERRSLGIDGRIDLFLQVCAAVEYAHRNLVVHRDLKPGNILVTPDGTVKLLDFGIAKVLDAGADAGTTALTHQAGRPMTPAYASPEQFRGEPITTATDVYALGVLLYQLLAGRTPYEVAGLSPGDLERLICTQDPITPSAALIRMAESGDSHAAGLSAASRRARRVRGDLDTIVLMALRKEPERRYQSVSAMADDLVRHREGRPVAARSDRFTYRAGKFARRRPGAVAAGVAALLSAGVYMGTLQAHAERLEQERNVAQVERTRAEDAQRVAEGERGRVELERDRADGERVRAEGEWIRAEDERSRAESERARAEAALWSARLETAKAQQITGFLVDLFRSSDPARTLGEAVTAQDLLNRGTERLEQLDSQPEVQANMMSVLGSVHSSLGLFPEAHVLLSQSLAVRRRLGTDQGTAYARAQNDLAQNYLWNEDLPAATDAYMSALETLRRSRLLGTADEAVSLNGLALIKRRNGDLSGAERDLRRALDIHRPDSANLLHRAATLGNLGVVLNDRGEWEEAERRLMESLRIRRSLLSEAHPDVLSTLAGLGILYQRTGGYEQAEVVIRQYAALREKTYGPEHPATALGWNDLAVLLQRRGKYAEAEDLFRRVIRIQHRPGPDIGQNFIRTLNNLALVLKEQGKFEESKTYFHRTLEMKYELHGEVHPSTAISLYNLASLHHDLGEYDAAEPLYRKVVEIDTEVLGENHFEVGVDIAKLATVLRDQGQYSEAEQLFARALGILRAALPGNHSRIGEALVGLGGLLVRSERHEEAEPILQEALAIRMEAFGAEHWQTGEAKGWLGANLLGQGRLPEAEPLLVEGYRVIVATRGSRNRYAHEALERLVRLYSETGDASRVSEFEDLLRDAQL